MLNKTGKYPTKNWATLSSNNDGFVSEIPRYRASKRVEMRQFTKIPTCAKMLQSKGFCGFGVDSEVVLPS